jgi:hypothetical protein
MPLFIILENVIMSRKYKNLSDTVLIENTKQEVAKERKATVAVIEYLEEIESRRLYSKYSYETLWEFVVKELGYDGGSAQRRINAMRISRLLPEVKEAITSAALCLTTVSMIEQFTKNEHKQGRKTYSVSEKKALLNQIVHKSTRETEALLRQLSPHASLPKERQRHVNAELVEINFLADAETIVLLKEIKRLLSGVDANPSTAQAIKHALRLAVAEKAKRFKPKADSLAKAIKPDRQKSIMPVQQRLKAVIPAQLEYKAVMGTHKVERPCQPEGKAAISAQQETKAAMASPIPPHSPAGVLITQQPLGEVRQLTRMRHPNRFRKYLSIHKRRAIFHIAASQCTYISPITNRRCQSRHQLQIEHIHPIAKRGSDDLSNLTLLCKSHNLYRAIQEFGEVRELRKN